MKKKRIIISIGIIVILLLYLVFSDNDKRSFDLPELTPVESIDEIIITQKDSTLKLNKKDDKWIVNEKYPADKVEIDKLVDGLKDLEITDYISKDHHIKYDLTPEKAIHVTAKNEDIIQRDILIGKSSSTYRSAYMKFTDDERIYLALGDLKNEYDNTLDDLRDKEIYKVSLADITWIQLRYKGKTLTFEKKTEEAEPAKADPEEKEDKEKDTKPATIEKWICNEYPKVDLMKSRVDSFVNSFSSVKADSFPEIEKKNLKGGICYIKGKAYGNEIELKIHKKTDDDKYLCSSSESDYVFTLAEYNVKKFFKEISDFKDSKK